MDGDHKANGISKAPPRLMKAKPVSAKRDAKTAHPDRETTLEVRKHRLVIPRGAVNEPVEIVMVDPGSEYVEVTIEATKRPDLQLSHPAVLTLSYRDRKKDDEPVDDLRVFEIIPGSDTIVGTPASKPNPHDSNKQEVEAQLLHFSGYAIGNGRVEPD